MKIPAKETLKELYHGQGMSMLEIARKYDVAEGTVSRWFARLGILARPAKRPTALQSRFPQTVNRELLEDMYVRRRMSLPDIGVYFSVSPSTVLSWFRQLGIASRSSSDARKIVIAQGKGVSTKRVSRAISAPTAYLPDYPMLNNKTG